MRIGANRLVEPQFIRLLAITILHASDCDYRAQESSILLLTVLSPFIEAQGTKGTLLIFKPNCLRFITFHRFDPVSEFSSSESQSSYHEHEVEIFYLPLGRASELSRLRQGCGVELPVARTSLLKQYATPRANSGVPKLSASIGCKIYNRFCKNVFITVRENADT
jgi:hypothetical protein